MNTESQLEKQFNHFTAQLAIMRKFLDTYGDKIPEGLGSLSLYSNAEFNINLGCRCDDNKERAKLAAGDLFGRDGWTAKPDYSGRAFDWSKEIDGMQLHILSAETLPPLQAMPVPPQKFPLQLEDAA